MRRHYSGRPISHRYERCFGAGSIRGKKTDEKLRAVGRPTPGGSRKIFRSGFPSGQAARIKAVGAYNVELATIGRVETGIGDGLAVRRDQRIAEPCFRGSLDG